MLFHFWFSSILHARTEKGAAITFRDLGKKFIPLPIGVQVIIFAAFYAPNRCISPHIYPRVELFMSLSIALNRVA